MLGYLNGGRVKGDEAASLGYAGWAFAAWGGVLGGSRGVYVYDRDWGWRD